jgi:hypothetical protein
VKALALGADDLVIPPGFTRSLGTARPSPMAATTS